MYKLETKEIGDKQKTKYVQIKKKLIARQPDAHIFSEPNTLVQIIDVSHKILYLDIKSQEHMFTMVNAMVSHELRNPLTSLLAQLEQQAKIKAQLNKFIADLRTAADAQQQYALPRVIAKLQTFEQDLTTTNKKIQQSSKFINYFIHDILDFSILRDGGHKFVKHESVFDVKDAVHEIVDILHDKAVMKNIAVDT